MALLNRLVLLLLFYATALLAGGCAKFNYLYEQGMGQISLLSSGKDNEEVIKNVRVPAAQKEKIKEIERLKEYFYKYWEKKETKIYSQTTMLKRKAVTYLVVSSPYQSIEAVETCFPLMGCFPYLGFFNLNSAKEFAKDLEKEDKVTWIRPVYAYSTLGYFTDTILSSFFEYDDYELAELIFHELFHTIFFVKNNVDLNESMANYFSERMLEDYFISIHREDYLKFEKKRQESERQVKEQVVFLALELQELYKSLLPKSKEEAQKILKEFLSDKFSGEVMKKCQALDIQPADCFPLQREWNNASFAAFLTYEKNSHALADLQKKQGLNLKEYYLWIVGKYEAFLKQSAEENFENYLLK